MGFGRPGNHAVPLVQRTGAGVGVQRVAGETGGLVDEGVDQGPAAAPLRRRHDDGIARRGVQALIVAPEALDEVADEGLWPGAVVDHPAVRGVDLGRGRVRHQPAPARRRPFRPPHAAVQSIDGLEIAFVERAQRHVCLNLPSPVSAHEYRHRHRSDHHPGHGRARADADPETPPARTDHPVLRRDVGALLLLRDARHPDLLPDTALPVQRRPGRFGLWLVHLAGLPAAAAGRDDGRPLHRHAQGRSLRRPAADGRLVGGLRPGRRRHGAGLGRLRPGQAAAAGQGRAAGRGRAQEALPGPVEPRVVDLSAQHSGRRRGVVHGSAQRPGGLGAGRRDHRVAGVHRLHHRQGLREPHPARAHDAGGGADLRLGGLLHPPDADGGAVPGRHHRHPGPTSGGGHHAHRLLDRRHGDGGADPVVQRRLHPDLRADHGGPVGLPGQAQHGSEPGAEVRPRPAAGRPGLHDRGVGRRDGRLGLPDADPAAGPALHVPHPGRAVPVAGGPVGDHQAVAGQGRQLHDGRVVPGLVHRPVRRRLDRRSGRDRNGRRPGAGPRGRPAHLAGGVRHAGRVGHGHRLVTAPARDLVRPIVVLAQQGNPGAAPLHLPPRDVLLEGDGRLAGADAGDGADLAGGRVGDFGVVPGVAEAELAARDAQFVGRNGDVQHQLVQRPVADIAHGGVTAFQGDDVDGVGDLVMAQADADDAFAPETLLIGQFGDPARFGMQVHIAAEDIAVGELGRGGEVAEVQLTDGALQPQAQLVVGRRGPGGQQARLGEEEALFLISVAGLADGRGFQPQAAFQRPFRVDAPRRLAEQFAARLLDLDRGGGQGLLDAVDGIGLVALHHVVGDFAARLEIHRRGPLIAHQAAQDGFG
uniref:LigA n=1 Tax=Parastrongyloides trichosuri TaxID=131310 RepID=A0A0N5A111_PARTI